MPSSHLILCHPLLLLPPIPPSIRVFSNESTLHMRWPKYWRFSFSIIPSKEHPGLISFRVDWLDLLAVQGTLKSLLQHHISKASFLRRSAFFTVQLSHLYMTTGKTIALTRHYIIIIPFFFFGGNNISSPSNFQFYSILLLSIITTLCIKSQRHFFFTCCKFVTLNISLIPPAPSPLELPFYFLFLWVWLSL